MPEQPAPLSAPPSLNLKDPVLAGFLAWLLPGLGHFYQGRYPKAVLYFVSILGIFVYGLYLGSDSQVGWGRVVYFSFRPNDQRLAYLCQVGIGLPALPALVQANRVRSGNPPLGTFMAPPRIGDGDAPTFHEINYKLHRYFELGTTYTMIAGLLNLLAVYDACCGPVPGMPAKKDDEEEDGDDKKNQEGAADGPPKKD